MTGRFLVHEHQATRLHYDFRLEMGGVLKSWAIPKGPSMDPADKRLAVMVDDHPLSYFGWEGIIPQGRYGSGAVVVWDHGTYTLVEGDDPEAELSKGRLVMSLTGQRLRGGFLLIQMKGRGPKNWLLMKKKDSLAAAGWRLAIALTPQRLETLNVHAPPCETA